MPSSPTTVGPGAGPAGSALCRECNYPLRGLAVSQCPECGTPFDPADPATVNTGRPLGRLSRMLLSPPGRPTWMLTALTALLTLWLFRLPAPASDGLPGAAKAALLWVPLLAWWAARAVLAAAAVLNRRQPWARPFGARRRWAVIPAALAVTLLVVAVGLPFRAALWMSRPWLDALAARTLAGPTLVDYPDTWAGLFPVERVYRLPGPPNEVGFALRTDPVVRGVVGLAVEVYPPLFWRLWASSRSDNSPTFGLTRTDGDAPARTFPDPDADRVGKYESPPNVDGFDKAAGTVETRTTHTPLGGGWFLAEFADKDRAWVAARRFAASQADPTAPGADELLPQLVAKLGDFPAWWSYHDGGRWVSKGLVSGCDPFPYPVVDGLLRFGLRSVPELLKAAERHPDEYVRVNAMRVIRLMRPPAAEVAGTLIGRLTSPEEQDGFAALEALEELGPLPAGSVDALAGGLSSPRATVRAGVIRLLAAAGPAGLRKLPEILAAADDPSPQVQTAVLIALERLKPGPEAVMKAAVPMLKNYSWVEGDSVSARAARLLAKQGTAARPALPAILAAMDDWLTAGSVDVRVGLTIAAAAVAPDDARAVARLGELLPTDEKARQGAHFREECVRAAMAMLRIDPSHEGAVLMLCDAVRVNRPVDKTMEIVRELGRVAPHRPGPTLDALTNLLHFRSGNKDPFPVMVVGVIGDIGPAAEPAVKTMERLTRFHPEPEYRQAVERAKAKILAGRK